MSKKSERHISNGRAKRIAAERHNAKYDEHRMEEERTRITSEALKLTIQDAMAQVNAREKTK